MNAHPEFSRRNLLKGGGALIVSFSLAGHVSNALAQGAGSGTTAGATSAKPLALTDVDSFLAIDSKGGVTCYSGKVDLGTGTDTALRQIVAEELDVPFNRVKVIMGDTATSVKQGGASGSTGIQSGGKQMRMAAAEARRVLVEMAAEKLKIQADQLAVTDGVVHAKSDTAKKASYAELIGGRYFNVQLEWNKQIGNALYAPDKAQPKSPKDYKIIGKPMKRADVAPKIFCQEDYVTDLKVPGMVHAA